MAVKERVMRELPRRSPTIHPPARACAGQEIVAFLLPRGGQAPVVDHHHVGAGESGEETAVAAVGAGEGQLVEKARGAQPRPESRNRVLLPNVCGQFNVRYNDTFVMLRELVLQFVIAIAARSLLAERRNLPWAVVGILERSHVNASVLKTRVGHRVEEDRIMGDGKGTEVDFIRGLSAPMQAEEKRGAEGLPFYRELLDQTLRFRRASGALATRDEYLIDLANPANRRDEIQPLGPIDCTVYENTALASVLLWVKGSNGGKSFSGRFRNVQIFHRDAPDKPRRLKMWFNDKLPDAGAPS